MTIDDLMTELDDATMSKAKLLGLLDRTDSDHDNEVLPVQIIVNVESARKPERLAEINANGG